MKIFLKLTFIACLCFYVISCGKGDDDVFVPPTGPETFKLNADGKMTFESINTIFASSCAGTTCHSGNQSPQFIGNYATAKANGANIASAVIAKTMPKNGSMSDVRIAAIKQWQTDGFLEK